MVLSLLLTLADACLRHDNAVHVLLEFHHSLLPASESLLAAQAVEKLLAGTAPRVDLLLGSHGSEAPGALMIILVLMQRSHFVEVELVVHDLLRDGFRLLGEGAHPLEASERILQFKPLL